MKIVLFLITILMIAIALPVKYPAPVLTTTFVAKASVQSTLNGKCRLGYTCSAREAMGNQVELTCRKIFN
jgi:hypothetical protein